MVERIEGFCNEDEWKRAYREINRFERQLVDFGTILFKFWIHISKEEQIRRFEDRKDTAYKAWKLTDEDWRNREKWDQYNEAVSEMLQKTSTITAPWTIVEGDCKWYARIKVLKTLVEGLSKELDYDPYKEMPALKKRKKKKKAKAKKGPQKKKQEVETPSQVEALPMIDKFEFGEMEIAGQTYKNDVVILPDGKVFDLKSTNEHQVSAGELKEIIKAKPEVLIIGSGTIGKLELEPEGLEELRQSGVEVMVYKTIKAVESYKAMRGQRKLAAIFHLAD
jgi:hypothetical protein